VADYWKTNMAILFRKTAPCQIFACRSRSAINALRLRQLQKSILPLHFHYFISYFFNLEINNRLISCFKFKYFDFDSIKICNVYMFAKEESNHKIEGSAVNYSMLKNKLG
jgi:hypothetical protein